MKRMIIIMQEKLKEIGADSMLDAARGKLKELGGESIMRMIGKLETERMIGILQEKLKEIGADSMLDTARGKMKELGGESIMRMIGKLETKRMTCIMQEKLKEIGSVSMLDTARGKLKEVGGERIVNKLTQKLKELSLVVHSFGGQFIGWLDETFPPETRRERLNYWIHRSAPVIITMALALLVFHLCCGGRRGGKMMKAPGRNYQMQRRNFEASPRSYFRDLRAKEKRN